MRVSIVATALDGQQPEAKSVINMVHRIQNRNSGYSDFSNTGSAQSFNFSPTISGPISHGANALKLENEIIVETETGTDLSKMMNEKKKSTEEIETTGIIQNNQANEDKQSFAEETPNDLSMIEEHSSVESGHAGNGLENFGVEEESAPDLFNSDNMDTESEGLLSTESNEDSSEDDNLEIPAFLRRQKN